MLNEREAHYLFRASLRATKPMSREAWKDMPEEQRRALVVDELRLELSTLSQEEAERIYDERFRTG